MNQLDILKKKISPGEFDDLKKSYKTLSAEDKKKAMANLKPTCHKFFETKEYKSADKNYQGYGVCCDILDLCKTEFYKKTWFFCVCGGVGLLLIAIIGVTVFFICRKKKGKSGGNGGSKVKASKGSKGKSSKGSKGKASKGFKGLGGGKKGRKAGGCDEDEDGNESNGSFKSDYG